MDLRKIRFKTILLITVTFFLLFGKNFTAYCQDASKKNIPNIIILTLNGVRSIDSIEDPDHQYILNIWNKMLPEGVLYNNLVDSNYAFHMPVVDAINTGTNYPLYYKINQPSTFQPSIFQYIRKKYALPANKLWLIGHWSENGGVFKTADYAEDTYPCQISALRIVISPELRKYLTKQEQIFIDSFNKLEEEKIIYFVHHWDSFGEIFYQLFKKIIKEFKPKFVHYVMGNVESAHYDTFSRYVIALKRSDEIIFEIWQMIQNDPFYYNNTYLIVSPDHERDLYYMHHDEKTYDNPSRVWMYIYGPAVKKGVIIKRPVSHIDIFATIAYILKTETNSTQGEILKDCFLE